MNIVLETLVRRIKQRAYLDTDEEIARWIEEYCEQSNSHKHSVVRPASALSEGGELLQGEAMGKGVSVDFYCADWNRCGSICEEQCAACMKADRAELL